MLASVLGLLLFLVILVDVSPTAALCFAGGWILAYVFQFLTQLRKIRRNR